MARDKSVKCLTPKLGTRYSFPDDFDYLTDLKKMVESKKAFRYEAYLRIIEEDPTKGVKEYFVFLSMVAYVFKFNFLKLLNLDKDKEENILINPFRLIYKNKYIEGRKHFDENFKVSPEVLYGKNGKLLERNLHEHYFHTNFKNFNKGWGYWEKYYSSVFSIETFAEYGYYAGIISALNEFKKLHPIIFQKFDECTKNHNNENRPSNSNEVISLLKSIRKENIVNKGLPISIVIEHFQVLCEAKNKNGKLFLAWEDFQLFIERAFFGINHEGKIKFSLANGSRSVIISLFYDFYTLACDYEPTIQVRDKYIKLLSENFDGFEFETIKSNFKPLTKKKL